MSFAWLASTRDFQGISCKKNVLLTPPSFSIHEQIQERVSMRSTDSFKKLQK